MTSGWVGLRDVAFVGAASSTIRLSFRQALLGTVAAGALSLASGSPALAAPPPGCTIDGTGTIETCTGDQHNGVNAEPPPVTTLNVNNLTTAIAPASGTRGINFYSTGPVTIISDTGGFGISVTGTASGLRARSTGAAVTVMSTGNITTAGDSSAAVSATSASSGVVTVTSTGNLTTGGSYANAIYTRSGLAGSGGISVTSTGTILTTGTQANGIRAYGYGGPVAITSTGNISTRGDYARAILTKANGNITVSSTGNMITAGIEANGIKAYGYGGSVAITSTGNITTTGLYSQAILAKNSANTSLTVISTGNIASAASGISAESHGALTVTSTGNIAATGSNFGYGIAAFGYGAAPTKITSTGNITTTGSSSKGISVKSAGDSDVTVASTGNITTSGIQASGIYIHSTGPGNVTVTSTGNISTPGGYARGIYVGETYHGNGAMTVTSIGNITTGAINNGEGIFVLAGYGGTGPITISSTGNISTAGRYSNGIRASGTGGAVAVTSNGNIRTSGAYANGIFASATDSSPVSVTSTGNITTAGDGAIGITAQGSGTVTVISIGNITTAGNQAHGITVASAGAATVISTGNITATGSQASAIGVNSSAGGDVKVTSTGNISTAGGLLAYAIEAVGEGAVTVTSTGNITASGNANAIFADAANGVGAVTVNSTGNIATAGDTGAAILAFGARAVSVTSAGNITTTGNNAYGIFAKSTGGGPITVTVASGTVSGGSGTGAGVALVGGSNNTLTNMGTITALSGLAIKGDTGNNTVNNFGTVIGNVILGSGANAFNNMAGGFFNSGVTVDLGAGNTLTNAGTLSPGGAGVIQTTALSGNLEQTATGRLFTDINIAGNTSDRVNVSGTANLAGAVQVQVQNPVLGPWQQTVLSAAGGTSNNGLSLLASPALQAQLVFPNATDVVVKSTGINFVVSGLGANQTSLGTALNGAAQTSGLGGAVFNFLLNGVTTLPGYNLALTQLSGEAATGTQQTTFNAMSSFMGTMLDPFNRDTTTSGGNVTGYAPEGDASAYASTGRKRTGTERDAYAMFTKAPPQNFEARWNVWAAAFGGAQSTDGNAALGSNSTTSSIAETAVGADYRFSPFTIAGFALAGGGTNFSILGSGGGRSDLFQAGAFIRHDAGAAYISAALAYGWQDIITNRTAFADRLRAEFNANAFSGRLEGGYRFVAPWVGGIGLTPYAAAQFTTFDLPAYAETALAGSSAFALSYAARSVTDPRSELGLRTDKSFAMPDGILTLRGRLAWAHDYDSDRAIGATFQSLPGASFVVNGAAQASDSVLTTASVEKKWLNGWSAAATFEGEFSNVTASYAGKGVVRYAW